MIKSINSLNIEGHYDSRQRPGVRRSSAAFNGAALKAVSRFACHRSPKAGAHVWLLLVVIIFWLASSTAFSAEGTLLYNATVHTGNGQTFTNSGVLINGEKI